jgi:hypothetical protein
VDLNWVVGDFFLQFSGIWYTLAQVRVRVPVWRYICVRLDTRAETATAVMDGQVLIPPSKVGAAGNLTGAEVWRVPTRVSV